MEHRHYCTTTLMVVWELLSGVRVVGVGWACPVPDCGAVKEKGSWGEVGMSGYRLWPHSKGEG